jgi:hypothetical protein
MPNKLLDRIIAKEIDPFMLAWEVWSCPATHRDPRLYAEIHPLGFKKIEIAYSQSGDSSLSLHFWDKGAPSSPLHTHHFDMKSYVISGCLLDVEYEAKENKEGLYLAAEIKYDTLSKTRAIDVSSSVVTPEILRTRIISASELYTISKGVFHNTSVLAKNTVTAMLRENCASKSTKILQERGIKNLKLEEIVMSDDQVIDLIAQHIQLRKTHGFVVLADIDGFTNLKTCLPEKLWVSILTSFFGECDRLIAEAIMCGGNGYIIGDGVLLFSEDTKNAEMWINHVREVVSKRLRFALHKLMPVDLQSIYDVAVATGICDFHLRKTVDPIGVDIDELFKLCNSADAGHIVMNDKLSKILGYQTN